MGFSACVRALWNIKIESRVFGLSDHCWLTALAEPTHPHYANC